MCELFVKKLLLKTECAILPDGALLIVMRAVGEVNLSDFCRYYQQPTNNTPELALRIGSRISCCRLYSVSPLSLYSMLPLVFLYLPAAACVSLVFRFAASLLSLLSQRLLLIFDIAAVCCDSRIVHWQEILSPSDWPLWLLRSAAALAMASIRHPGGLYFALFLVRNFP